MKDIKHIDLTQAGEIFAVANTPLFLLRKLRESQAVSEAKEADEKEILESLQDALKQEQNTLTEAVRPYVYLVALSQKENDTALKEAAKYDSLSWHWYSLLAQRLLEEFSPIFVQNIVLPNYQPIPTIRPQSSSPAIIFST